MLHLVLVFLLFVDLLHTVLLLHLHLLLVLEEQHLLDLLLSHLLVDHFLLSGEAVFFDLLTTALNLELLVVNLVFIQALTLFQLLLLLHLKEHHLLLLLFVKTDFFVLFIPVFLVILLILIIFVIFTLLTVFTPHVELGIDQFLELLFGNLESVWVLFILLLEVGNQKFSLLLVELVDVEL